MAARRIIYLATFLMVPALSAVTPLIAIPAITSTAGVRGWEAYALGLSIGSAACVIVELGWPLTGPQRVAAEAPGRRWETLVASVRSRLLVLLVLGPLAVLVAVALTRLTGASYTITAALMALASAATGLSGNWYFTGVGRPLRILWSDALPRALVVTATSLAVVAGAPLQVIPAGFLIAVLFSPVASLLLARHEREGKVTLTLRDDLRIMREQFTAMSGRSVAALYAALPITLVGVFAPAALAAFAAAERLMRMALTVLQAVPNALQNWLGSAPTRAETRRRVGTVIKLNVALGVVSGIGFALLAPWVSTILFTGAVTIDPLLAAAAGGVMALVCLTRALGPLGLVRYGRVHMVTISAIVAAAVGVPAICVFAVLWGAVGATIGEIVAEATAATVQSAALARAMRR
jgi:O-antigen/teichoic acid export membrane protein